MAEITLQGNPIQTHGDLPHVGTPAPDFRLVNRDLKDVSLADFGDKRKLLSIVPSLDTGVCATSTTKFEKLLADRDDAVVLVISADLPFAQSRFCAAEKLERVHTLSMMRSKQFAKDYGVLIQDGPLAGITARAVLVLDADNMVMHAELVPEIAQEPDYDAAIRAISTD